MPTNNAAARVSLNYFGKYAADFSFTCKKIVGPLDVRVQTTGFQQSVAHRQRRNECD